MAPAESLENANGAMPNGIGKPAQKDKTDVKLAKGILQPSTEEVTASSVENAFSERGRLLKLANSIQVQVSEIQKYLTETNQPDPSFDGQAKLVDFSGVDDVRSDALEKITELQDLLYTPHEMLSTKAVSRFDPICPRERC